MNEEMGDGEKKIRALNASDKAKLEQKDGPNDAGTQEALAVKRQSYTRNLDDEAKVNDHDRKELFREHFEKIIIVLMWATAIGFLFLAAVRLLNTTIPDHCRWLSEREIFGLQSILTGGLIIGLVSDHIKRRTQ